MQELETAPEEEEHSRKLDTVRGVLFVHPRAQFVPLAGGKLTFGRDSACSVRLEGALVSRVHASIQRVGTNDVLCDEGSRNGTRQNGEPVSDGVLEDDDVLRIGDWVGVVLRVSPAVVRSGELFFEPAPGIVVGPRTRELWQRLSVLAPSQVPVLLVAPSGCGKEIFARALHRESGRQGPFVAQNCAAIPDALMEAHLFGHTRGAFTGATVASAGLFVDADGGTLLLDEIADLPLSQQAKLLRVIEERAVVPVGGSKVRSLNVRILAASQMSLRERVEEGRFRGDLLARLAGATLSIPTLAERREEAPYLFSRSFREAGADPGRLQATLVEKLCLLEWSYNVRELKLLAESMAVLYPSGPLGAVELEEAREKNTSLLPKGGPDRMAPRVGAPEDEGMLGRRRALWLARNSEQARKLTEALRRHDGNVSKAARDLGISRQRAQRLLKAIQERSGSSE